MSHSFSSGPHCDTGRIDLTPKIRPYVDVNGTDIDNSASQQLPPLPQIPRSHLTAPQFRTKSEMTMGNMALASLCARTLDSVASTAANSMVTAPLSPASSTISSLVGSKEGDKQKDQPGTDEEEEEEKENKANRSSRRLKSYRRKR
eukprot:14007338-Ditylum_brightwellii.AAC.1